MSLIEIEQLIEKEKFFMPKNSDKLIKTVFSQSKECQRKNEQLEMKIEGLFGLDVFAFQTTFEKHFIAFKSSKTYASPI